MKKKVDQTKIKWKKYLQNFWKFLSWMLDLLLKLFPLTSVWLKVATWVCMKSWKTLESFNAILVPSAPFCYSFKTALRTRLLYCWSLNNFESSLILQFFKCYETKPLQVWSLPPHKTALFSKNFVLQFIIVFRSSHWNCTVKKCYWKFEKFHTKTPVLEFLFNKAVGLRACNFYWKGNFLEIQEQFLY